MDQFANSTQVETLIEKVKNYSAIYDSNDKNHSNRVFIASVWREIGEDLGIPDERAKKKWHQLRCNYMRAKRLDKYKSPGSASKVKWPFYQAMSFLDQYAETRESPSFTQAPSPPTYTTEQVKCESEELFEETEEDFLSQLKPEEPEVGIKRKAAAVEEPELRLVSKPAHDDSDPDKMFLLSLLPYLKHLTPADNLDFKLFSLQFLKGKLNLTSTGNQGTSWQSPPPQNQRQFHWSEPDMNSSVSTSQINERNFFAQNRAK